MVTQSHPLSVMQQARTARLQAKAVAWVRRQDRLASKKVSVVDGRLVIRDRKARNKARLDSLLNSFDTARSSELDFDNAANFLLEGSRLVGSFERFVDACGQQVEELVWQDIDEDPATGTSSTVSWVDETPDFQSAHADLMVAYPIPPEPDLPAEPRNQPAMQQAAGIYLLSSPLASPGEAIRISPRRPGAPSFLAA